MFFGKILILVLGLVQIVCQLKLWDLGDANKGINAANL